MRPKTRTLCLLLNGFLVLIMTCDNIMIVLANTLGARQTLMKEDFENASAQDSDSVWESCRPYYSTGSSDSPMEFRRSPQVHRGVIFSAAAYQDRAPIEDYLWFLDYTLPDPKRRRRTRKRKSHV